MRAPDHPTGDEGGNNAGGNSGGDSANANSGENNAGQAPDYSQFWNSPPSGGNSPPQGDSAGGNQSGGGTPQGGDSQQQGNSGQEFGRELATRLSQTQFAPVFTDEVVTALDSGNLQAANEAIANVGRQAVQQAVVMTAEIMQRFGGTLLSRAEAMIKEQLGNRDNDATLMENFPQVAANPAIAPMVKMVFDQSLVNAGGDRQKAIQMTKDMLTLMTTNVGNELGLNTPPPAGGDGMTVGAKSLVADLLGR